MKSLLLALGLFAVTSASHAVLSGNGLEVNGFERNALATYGLNSDSSTPDGSSAVPACCDCNGKNCPSINPFFGLSAAPIAE